MSEDRILEELQQRVARLGAAEVVDAEEFRAVVEEYARMSHQFAKVLAISDKYQRLLETVANGGSGIAHRTGNKTERRGAGPRGAASRKGDPGARGTPGMAPDVEALVRRLRQHADEDVRTLANHFEKQQAQLVKIMSISDVYQSQLRETTLKLELMARTDMLTELANRRDMSERLEMESARSARSGQTFGVILFDIDNFKRVNDTYGHDAGDRVLISVAETFRAVLRGSDVCARWGGEEFLILCPETDLEQTRAVAEKCRQAVERREFPQGLEFLRITISGGVSATRQPQYTWERMLRDADTALYEAKNSGKNKVISAASASGP